MATGPVAPGLCNYWTVNDSSPGTQVWDLVAGAFVAVSDATFLAWLAQLTANPVEAPYWPYTLQILSAASSDGGATTTFAVNDTSIMTTGAKYNIGLTGLYDGQFALTVVDGTHLKTVQAFAGNCTGNISGAAITPTMAGLLAAIDAQNQGKTPPSFLAVTSGVNYQMANTPPLVFQFTATASGLFVDLPQMNVPGSLAKGRRLFIINSGNVATFRQFSAGGNLIQVPSGGVAEIELTSNTSQRGAEVATPFLGYSDTTAGNADTSFLFTRWFNIVRTSATLTAPRTYTLPSTSGLVAGSLYLIMDAFGGLSSTNTLSIANGGGGDTINGSAASVVLNRARAWLLLECEAGNWTIIGGKGSLASTDLVDFSTLITTSTSAGGDVAGTYPTPTVAKVNAVVYPAAPSTNTVPVVTGSNTVTYEQVPNAALANSSVTIAGHSVALGGSQSLATTDLSDVTSDTTWTPTDASGAGLTFSTATGVYYKIGNQYWLYATVVYPTTADTSNAVIGGFPATVINQKYGRPLSMGVNDATGVQINVAPKQNTTTTVLLNASTGALLKNSDLSAVRINFMAHFITQ